MTTQSITPGLDKQHARNHHASIAFNGDHRLLIGQERSATQGASQPVTEDVLQPQSEIASWLDARPMMSSLLAVGDDSRTDMIALALAWPSEHDSWPPASDGLPNFDTSFYNPRGKPLNEDERSTIQTCVAYYDEILRELGSQSFDYLREALSEYVGSERFLRATDAFPAVPDVAVADGSLYSLTLKVYHRGWYVTVALRSADYPAFQAHLANIEGLKEERTESARRCIASL